MASVLSWLAWFVSSWALWLILAGSFARGEALAGVGVAIVAATLTTAMRRGRPQARVGAAELRRLARALAAVPGDHLRLARVLWREILRRPSASSFEERPLGAGAAGGREPEGRAIARRALVPAAESLSPAGCVVDVDPESDVMLVHRLVP